MTGAARKRETQAAWHLANRERRNQAARERYQRNREEILARQAVYKAANKELIALAQRAYYEKHVDAIAEKSRQAYEQDRDAKLAAMLAYRARPEWASEQARRRQQWKAANRERVVEYQALRRARKLGLEAERIVRSVLWDRDGGTCRICGLAADADHWHIDHIVPVSAGGAHTYANTAVSHPACNLAKGSNDPRSVESEYAYLLDPSLQTGASG